MTRLHIFAWPQFTNFNSCTSKNICNKIRFLQVQTPNHFPLVTSTTPSCNFTLGGGVKKKPPIYFDWHLHRWVVNVLILKGSYNPYIFSYYIVMRPMTCEHNECEMYRDDWWWISFAVSHCTYIRFKVYYIVPLQR